jgi:hypothetical protein
MFNVTLLTQFLIIGKMKTGLSVSWTTCLANKTLKIRDRGKASKFFEGRITHDAIVLDVSALNNDNTRVKYNVR